MTAEATTAAPNQLSSDYTGKTAVITGGARGFGHAFGRALYDRGAHVVLVDLQFGTDGQTDTSTTASSARVTPYVADVTDEDRMTTVMSAVAEERGGIDILINNAGLHSDEYSQSITHLGVAKTRRLFEVNVMGVVTTTLAARPFLNPNASVINISSAAAHLGGTAYGTSKRELFLTSPNARFITGETLRVTGGMAAGV